MTGSSPTYDSLQTCASTCSGIGTQIYRASPSGSRIDGQCSVMPYAKGLPLGHPVISPALAPPEYLTGSSTPPHQPVRAPALRRRWGRG